MAYDGSRRSDEAERALNRDGLRLAFSFSPLTSRPSNSATPIGKTARRCGVSCAAIARARKSRTSGSCGTPATTRICMDPASTSCGSGKPRFRGKACL